MKGYAYRSGVHVLGTSIWCDAARARAVCFVSRGDAAIGKGRAERFIATAQAAAIRRALSLPCAEPLLPRFGRPFALGRARLELLPSGRLPGAAQLLVELGDWRGLYAGSVALSPLAGAEPLQARACDELVLDAPQAGGVVDGMDAVTRAVGEGATVLAIDDVAVLLAVVAELGAGAVELRAPWTKLGAVFAELKTKGKKDKARRATSVRIEKLRVGARAIEVRLGMRRRDEKNVIALGLLPDAAALAGFAADTDARRVHVRIESRAALELAGAQALIVALGARSIAAGVLGAPEQLSLFEDVRLRP